jgi:serine phosphatase RsbU (regulator of sigma subunit)
MKLRRILTLTGAMLLGVIVLGVDLVRTSVAPDVPALPLIRDIVVILAFVLLFFFIELSDKPRNESPVRKLGVILIMGTVLGLVTAILTFLEGEGSFESKGGELVPLNFRVVFLASFAGLSFAVFAILVFRVMRDLILYKRRKGTWRNLMIQLALMVATALSTVGSGPLETSVVTSILFATSIASMAVNAFRLSWIVYLTKREKVFTLVYAFLLFVVLTLVNVFSHTGPVQQLLLYHSHPLREFTGLIALFGNVYAGMAFVSTLFHLPTAEAFERKTSEVTSLHNLGRLINQVFDFDELIDTVTSMTLQVCEAKACWLEIVHRGDHPPPSTPERPVRTMTGGEIVRVLGMRNISPEDIDRLLPFGESTLRDIVVSERKPIVIDDLLTDPRVKAGKKEIEQMGARSLVVVPLLSHTEITGILYAAKETEHGFFKDDVEVISAFADQATIAIENSRLIDESIERERLAREMMLAQEMQKRLLPQNLPHVPGVELDAVSTPALEVGGDYYDVAILGERRLGVVVGDVSGKGVSAAFYMSEVKGIFQSLSRIHSSPRDLLLHANEVLSGSIDRRWFISLIYSVLDIDTGVLRIARAGHCPMLLATTRGVRYIRPPGMGLGLSGGSAFSGAVEEEMLQLSPGDVCVFYTDGLTEARNGEDEFGYTRLEEAMAGLRDKKASEIRELLLGEVRAFTNNQSLHDDLTLVVLKWWGPNNRPI